MALPNTTNVNMLDAVAVDSTGNSFDVSQRQLLSLQFSGDDVATDATGTFTVEVSNDNSHWVAYNRLTSDVTNTNGQFDTRVASVVIDDTTASDYVLFPTGDYFRYIRVNLALVGGLAIGEIVDAGADYEIDDVLTLDGGDGNATITVTAVDGDGAITAFDITDAGTGYSEGTYDLLNGSGTAATFELTQTDAGVFTATLEAAG